jgi:serine/threonine-protein kinase
VVSQSSSSEQTVSDDSENWSLLQALFELAEQTPVAERERVLAERCPDPALVRRALAIVHSSACLELERPSPLPNFMPNRVGPYTLLRRLGAGGIGTVYLAERIVGGSPQRSALKMLGPQAEGAAFIERFHREQHILASLDHVNITRLFDAGLSDSGQPYLVMEYVDGEHLGTYCDARRLTVRDRLHLFLKICEAVAYAHRKLIVHLDLKPSNILVTADGSVKLLDFGTSKLIQTDNRPTTTLLATPGYASPEQLRNEPISTACDIYSLGVILFELLCGRRPGASASVAIMIERALTEQPPESLADAVSEESAERRTSSKARLIQSLRGDLDTITGKCLRPRPQERFASVDLLIQDIERHLQGRPVLARPQTTFYRVGKFLRRNRNLVAAGTLVVVALAFALGYGEVKQRRALEAGRRAEQMQNFMYSLLRLSNAGFMGKPDPTIADFLHVGAQVLPQYIQDPADLRVAQLSLARSLAENDHLDDAAALYSQADRSAKAGGDINAEADAELHLGEIAYIKGAAEKGAALTAHALQLSRDPRVTPLVRANSEMFYAFYRDNMGFRADDNLRLLRDAVELEKKTRQPPNELGTVIKMLADDYLDRGQPDAAEPWLLEAQQVLGSDPTLLCNRAQVESGIAYIASKRGDPTRAIAFQQQAYQDISRCAGETSHQATYEATYLAEYLLKAGRNQQALSLIEKTIPVERGIIPASTDFSDSLRVLGKAYLRTGHLPEAEAALKEAIAIRTGHTAADHPAFGVLYLYYSETLLAEHRDREALPQAEAADRILSAAAAATPALNEYATESAQVLAGLRGRLGIGPSKPHS